MRLYYRPDTGRPMRVAWALEEVGVPYEAVAVSREQASGPEHLARHPLGRVPALELDSGETLFDSTALVLQVADLHPDAGLIGPLGSDERGQAYEWCLTAMTELERPPPDVAQADDPERRRTWFTTVSDAFADALEGREFLVADRFGVADIVLGGVLLVGEYRGLVGGEANAAAPRLLDYLAALRARPAFARAAERTESLLR